VATNEALQYQTTTSSLLAVASLQPHPHLRWGCTARSQSTVLKGATNMSEDQETITGGFKTKADERVAKKLLASMKATDDPKLIARLSVQYNRLHPNPLGRPRHAPPPPKPVGRPRSAPKTGTHLDNLPEQEQMVAKLVIRAETFAKEIRNTTTGLSDGEIRQSAIAKVLEQLTPEERLTIEE